MLATPTTLLAAFESKPLPVLDASEFTGGGRFEAPGPATLHRRDLPTPAQGGVLQQTTAVTFHFRAADSAMPDVLRRLYAADWKTRCLSPWSTSPTSQRRSSATPG